MVSLVPVIVTTSLTPVTQIVSLLAVRFRLALSTVIVVGGIALHFYNRRPPQVTDTVPAISEKSESAPSRNLSTRKQAAAASEEIEAQADREGANPLEVPREKIEEYLKLHNRDGASLLAAFHAASDPERPGEGIGYLKEAATNFPGDPHVQLTVLAQDAFPEERRKWLDAFKASSPSNSLANYLLEREY